MKKRLVLNNISLRCKLTLLMTILVTLIALSLTSVSILNANKIFFPIQTINVSSEEIQSASKQSSVTASTVTSDENLPNTVDMIRITVQKTTFQNYSILIMALIILLGTFFAWLMIGKALKSLHLLTQAIECTNIKKLHQTIDPSEMSDLETTQLARAFHQFTEKIDNAFASQKRFTAAAAHELKTPLACIQTEIEVLQLDESPSLEEYQQTMNVILRNTNRLIELTNNLLTMYSKKNELLESIFIEDIIKEIHKTLQYQLEEKQITFHYDCNGSFIANYDMLYRAFLNIIENAVKYNKKNGNIIIKSTQTNDTLFLSIADTGIGISPKEQKAIFEPFYRVDSSRCRKIAGSGLGLSIAKEIIMQYNGTIRLESELEKGTTFFISFDKTNLQKS